MPILQIEHPVQSYEGWKKVFDSDPINRKRSGVKRYRICKFPDEPNLVMIELDFDNREDLDKALSALQGFWNQVQGSLINNPKTRIIEVIESKEI